MSLKRLQKIQFNINDKIGQIEKLVGKEGDNLTRGLEIQLLHNSVVVDDISDIDCMLIAKQKGAGVEDTFVVPSIKVNNKFEIIYPSNLMKKGIVEAEIRFTQGEQILTSFIFGIDMARTLVVEEITDSIYEQRLIDVIVEVVANEEARIANENTRIKNENERLASETERKSSEIERDNQESIRQSNEDARIDEENTRQSNESTRQTNESIRESNEITRQSNENTRKSNEEDRVAFYEMLQQMLENGELNGEVTLAELNELAGEGRTNETVKGNADDIQDITKTLNSHLAENSNIHKAFGEGSIYFAHRGFSGYYPENTILSINKAQQYGFKGVEVDVGYTLDGDWVLMHDSTVDRTTNGTGILSNLTTNYIKSLEIDGGNGVEFLENTNGMGDKKVPFLYEALEVCNRNGLYLQIEIKSSGLNYIDDLLSMIEDYNMVDRVFIISFNYSQLEFIRNISDKFMLMHVVDSVTESIINDVYALGNCGISANYNSNSLNVKDLIKKCHNKNIVIGFWTVNSLTTADDLVGMGADFITSDTIKGGKYIVGKRGYTFRSTSVLGFRKDYGYSDCTIEIIHDSTVPLSGDNAVRVTHAVPFEGPIDANNGQAHASSNFAGYHTHKIEVFTKTEKSDGFIMVFRNRETGDIINPNNLPWGYWCNVIVLGKDRIN